RERQNARKTRTEEPAMPDSGCPPRQNGCRAGGVRVSGDCVVLQRQELHEQETLDEAPARAFPHQPALDGLRAVAVLAVIAYHLGYGWAAGGYLGVDAFFVLSGYLITSLLLVEYAAGGRIDLT